MYYLEQNDLVHTRMVYTKIPYSSSSCKLTDVEKFPIDAWGNTSFNACVSICVSYSSILCEVYFDLCVKHHYHPLFIIIICFLYTINLILFYLLMIFIHPGLARQPLISPQFGSVCLLSGLLKLSYID